VERRGTEAAEGFQVNGGAIPFVLRETVTGIFGVQLFETRVPVGFGENGCGGDGDAAGITLDERLLFDQDV
jgi:hypothetical protein